MAHLIDKDALVSEIEKCYSLSLKRADNYWNGKADAYRNVLIILSTMQEPVSEELEQAAIEYCGGHKGADARVRAGFIMGAMWQEEKSMNISYQ